MKLLREKPGGRIGITKGHTLPIAPTCTWVFGVFWMLFPLAAERGIQRQLFQILEVIRCEV